MLHSDWSTPAFDLEPAAPNTGPFPRRPFLETWWRLRSAGNDRLTIADTGDGLAPLLVRDGIVQFAGEPDLTDYHSPLGAGGASAVAEALTAAGAIGYHFDSLPDEAAALVAKALAEIGADPDPIDHAAAAVLALPATLDQWIDGLPKKERHEVRRKGRRLASLAGEPELVRGAGMEGLAAFVAMHRRAAGAKGRFMDGPMERFFAALLAGAGFTVDLLVAEGRPLAAAFGHETADGYYLYNSSYEPDLAAGSPGLALVTELIAAQIARGAVLFDFLKGDEPYKLKLGADLRPLHGFTGRLP